jgi:FtsH-binding integral membrane protein
MSQYPTPFSDADPYAYGQAGAGSQVLSRFFNAVYAWMAAGLALTAVIAFYIGGRPDILASIGGGGIIGLFVLQLVLVFVISAAINKINANVATLLFLIYAALNGVTLSVIFAIYAKATIGGAFIITAGTFGVMSVYGYTTGRDLTRIGSLCFMGLIGVVLASVVSIFVHSTMLVTAINYIGVLVFIGLTAYDTQRLKAVAMQTQNNAAMAARLSINGALMLYLDFLNLFLMILSLMSGNDRRR